MGGGGSKEVTIRSFSGDDNVDNYVAEVEVAIVMFSLSDTEAANNVARALTGKTGLWFENLKKEQPVATASWIKLKARVSFIIALANFNACLRTSRPDHRDRVTQNPHDMKKTNSSLDLLVPLSVVSQSKVPWQLASHINSTPYTAAANIILN